MIPLSLLFVLASLGLLLWGLAATSQVLVWGSLGASIAAGLCLSVAVLQRRGQVPAAELPSTELPAFPVDLARPGVVPPVLPPTPPSRGRSTEPPPGGTPTAVGAPLPPPAQAGIGTRPPADGVASGAQMPARPPPPPSQTRPPSQAPPPGAGTTTRGSGSGTSSAVDRAGVDAEPPVEDVPVGVALRAAQLDHEVLVVDGRPRYHLAECPFLAGRPTVALPLSTARRSGFTPCGLCGPDATLLARARR